MQGRRCLIQKGLSQNGYGVSVCVFLLNDADLVPPGANVMLTSLLMQIDTHQRPRCFTKAKIILPHTGPGLALIKNQHAPPRKKLIKARINGQMPHFCCSRSQAVRLRVENLKAALVNCRLL